MTAKKLRRKPAPGCLYTSWKITAFRGFYKLDEIGNNTNIGIRGICENKKIQ